MSTRRAKTVSLPEKPRLLIVETGLIGELLVVTPLLRAIGKARPGADVTVVVRPGSAPVLVGNPYVTRLLPLAAAERKGVLGAMRLASWIRSRDLDAALLLDTSFRSALVALMGAVPVRAGLSTERRGFLLTHSKPRDRDAFEGDEHLAVLGLLGVPPDGRELEIFLADDERRAARELVGPPAEGRPRVGLHPGAGRANLRWPLPHFVELGLRLEREAGASAVFFFGPGEDDLARGVRELYRSAGRPVPPVVFPKSVRALAAAFELMDVAVTNNSGPMYVAAAVRTPGVFISGPTPVSRSHPPGPRNTSVVSKEVECRPCDLPRCRFDRLACLEDVRVETVLGRVVHHLDEVGHRGSAAYSSGRGAGGGGDGVSHAG